MWLIEEKRYQYLHPTEWRVQKYCQKLVEKEIYAYIYYLKIHRYPVEMYNKFIVKIYNCQKLGEDKREEVEIVLIN